MINFLCFLAGTFVSPIIWIWLVAFATADRDDVKPITKESHSSYKPPFFHKN